MRRRHYVDQYRGGNVGKLGTAGEQLLGHWATAVGAALDRGQETPLIPSLGIPVTLVTEGGRWGGRSTLSGQGGTSSRIMSPVYVSPPAPTAAVSWSPHLRPFPAAPFATLAFLPLNPTAASSF